MSVPKATIDEDDFLAAGEHQIGFAWQRPIVESIPVSDTMEGPSQKQLGFRVLRPNLCHMRTAKFGAHEISHDASIVAE